MRWMEYQKGYLRVRRHELRLSYSNPRGAPEALDSSVAPGLLGPSCRPASLSDVSTGDWICSRCSSHNFRRRDQCYKCQLPRSQVQSLSNWVDGVDLIGTTPCNTLVLRCLDALTTEEDICKVFEETADVKVRQCHVMRDEVMHVSRCFAFAELPSVADAYKVMDIVSKQYKLFEIGGKAVTISYAKNTFTTIMATLKTEGSYNAQLNSTRNLAVDLAQVAMAVQNTNMSADKIAINAVAASALLSQSVPSGAAVAHAAIQQKQTEQHVISALAKSMRSAGDHASVSSAYPTTIAALATTGQTLPSPTFPFNAAMAAATVYPSPDTSKYIYDESSRFYYDPVTGLLYEPNSKYFYDRATVRYYYWDQTRSTYFPVPQPNAEQPTQSDSNTACSNSSANAQQSNSENKETVVRPSKGKSAQQIAKEMEKWAKRMNAQKKNPSVISQPSEPNPTEVSRTADTCFSLLEAAASNAVCPSADNDTSSISPYHSTTDARNVGPSRRDTLTDIELEEEGKVADEESRLVDWAKLACLLCSRGFKDAATLQKHRSFSSLHIENLNKLRTKHGLSSLPIPSATDVGASSSSTVTIASLMQMGAQAANEHAKSVASRQSVNAVASGSIQYRDRAKERREKYGLPPPPKIKYAESVTSQSSVVPPDNPASVTSYSGISVVPTGPNVGSRLMEKMGWQAGQGLGRANQGRTQVIEAEFREHGVGLGIKTAKRGPPSDNYKDHVKRAMFARFHEIE
ncbi:RNA-binding protein 5 [Fasciola gigantica]|uniref:RNA-binding protein 5 n=1 Tax=Fasciola gigantica TaxID=46835 RepID=A0A504YST0_FASGI|nr:RNA-binding protein 5 [Fasciola gigantica]